jgi:hypothetical protein
VLRGWTAPGRHSARTLLSGGAVRSMITLSATFEAVNHAIKQDAGAFAAFMVRLKILQRMTALDGTSKARGSQATIACGACAFAPPKGHTPWRRLRAAMA